MSELVKVEINDGVATLTLQNGKVNALGSAVFAELNAALDQAEEQNLIVVLKGSPGIFSGGYDLKEMSQGMDVAVKLVTIGSKFTRRLLSTPCPVIGVCEGHAIAKGCFMMLSCDYRIGTAGDFNLGLNESAIGMTMHHAGIELARQRMPKRFFNRSVMNAEMYDPETAVEAGILDVVLPHEEVDAKVEQTVAHFKALVRHAFSATKVKAREEMLAALDKGIEIDSQMA